MASATAAVPRQERPCLVCAGLQSGSSLASSRLDGSLSLMWRTCVVEGSGVSGVWW